MNLCDLKHIDDQLYRNLTELLDLDDVSMLGLKFAITEEKKSPGGRIFITHTDSSCVVILFTMCFSNRDGGSHPGWIGNNSR